MLDVFSLSLWAVYYAKLDLLFTENYFLLPLRRLITSSLVPNVLAPDTIPYGHPELLGIGGSVNLWKNK